MKYIASLIIVFILSNCEVKVRESKANYGYRTQERLITINNMKYYLFISDGFDAKGVAHSINLTKDSLEVEYYKKMLKTN